MSEWAVVLRHSHYVLVGAGTIREGESPVLFYDRALGVQYRDECNTELEEQRELREDVHGE